MQRRSRHSAAKQKSMASPSPSPRPTPAYAQYSFNAALVLFPKLLEGTEPNGAVSVGGATRLRFCAARDGHGIHHFYVADDDFVYDTTADPTMVPRDSDRRHDDAIELDASRCTVLRSLFEFASETKAIPSLDAIREVCAILRVSDVHPRPSLVTWLMCVVRFGMRADIEHFATAVFTFALSEKGCYEKSPHQVLKEIGDAEQLSCSVQEYVDAQIANIAETAAAVPPLGGRVFGCRGTQN